MKCQFKSVSSQAQSCLVSCLWFAIFSPDQLGPSEVREECQQSGQGWIFLNIHPLEGGRGGFPFILEQDKGVLDWNLNWPESNFWVYFPILCLWAKEGKMAIIGGR